MLNELINMVIQWRLYYIQLYLKNFEKLFAENKTSPLLKPQEKDFHQDGPDLRVRL